MEINELLSSDTGDKHRHGLFSAAAAVEMGISYWRNFVETMLFSPWQKRTPKTCICISISLVKGYEFFFKKLDVKRFGKFWSCDDWEVHGEIRVSNVLDSAKTSVRWLKQ